MPQMASSDGEPRYRWNKPQAAQRGIHPPARRPLPPVDSCYFNGAGRSNAADIRLNDESDIDPR